MWLLANDRPAAEILSAAGLPACPSAAPARLAAFHAFFALLARLAETEGPDLGARIATPEALQQLGTPARAIRASRTLREALVNISRTLHHHASQVFFLAETVPGGMKVSASIPLAAPPEQHHQAQQHIASLVCTIGQLAFGQRLPARIRLMPHARFGVAHLEPLLGPDLEASPGQLRMLIDDAWLDGLFPWHLDARDDSGAESGEPVARQTLTESARVLIAGMVEDGNPSLDRLALMAGRSRRTMQRLLADERTSFAELLDSIRCELALAQLSGTSSAVASIAGDVGYKAPSSLSRAVRRWTESNPRQLRKSRSA